MSKLYKVAALFVESGGAYFGNDGIDPWDEVRDARTYCGPHPVIAHPPCQRWGKFWAGSPFVIARTGKRKIKGDDGGCFSAALAAVRKFGGVLEHPEGSHAWAHFGLNKPPRLGGWIVADNLGGWTCCIEQGRYGHYARKPSWLYVVGCSRNELLWGKSEMRLDPDLVERIGIKKAKRLGEVCSKSGGHRIRTPQKFRELLISMASSANIKGG